MAQEDFHTLSITQAGANAVMACIVQAFGECGDYVVVRNTSMDILDDEWEEGAPCHLRIVLTADSEFAFDDPELAALIIGGVVAQHILNELNSERRVNYIDVS